MGASYIVHLHQPWRCGCSTLLVITPAKYVALSTLSCKRTMVLAGIQTLNPWIESEVDEPLCTKTTPFCLKNYRSWITLSKWPCMWCPPAAALTGRYSWPWGNGQPAGQHCGWSNTSSLSCYRLLLASRLRYICKEQIQERKLAF